MPPQRPAFSRPVFEQSFSVASEHAQRLLERGFHLVVRALYGIDAVLPVIGDPAEIQTVEEVVTGLIAGCAEELRTERDRLEKLCEDAGIAERPRYTHPEEVRVRVTSPQVAQYAALIRQVDALMIAMDALWLTGVLSNQQRADGAYAWRRRVLRLGRSIIELERRAQASARRRDGEQVDGEAGPEAAQPAGETPAQASDAPDDHTGVSAAPATD